ncbi:hypothetical protein D3C80_1578190 [compost metagenome]
MAQTDQQPFGLRRAFAQCFKTVQQLRAIELPRLAQQRLRCGPDPVVLARRARHFVRRFSGHRWHCELSAQLRPFCRLQLDGQIHRPISNLSANSHDLFLEHRSMWPCYSNMKPAPHRLAA